MASNRPRSAISGALVCAANYRQDATLKGGILPFDFEPGNRNRADYREV